MASGFICVTRPGCCELGFEAHAHQGVERLVLDFHPVLRRTHWRSASYEPTPSGRWSACSRLASTWGGWGDGCAGRDTGRQYGIETTNSIPGQPPTHREAVDTQQAGHLLAVPGLPGSQQVEHVQTGLLVAVMFLLQSRLQSGFIFLNQR
jgi:hypothetical protein